MDKFVVSARKYRPATFRSVVGQSHITETLRNAIQRGQLAHAYLFCGPRGVGKTTCARIFAKAINCLNPTPESEACGVCDSCRGFDEGRSMNIHELDAASNNSVEDIRSLIEQVRVMPQVGRYSLFIIDEVHMLSTAAFNAFLKTLEEPPAHAIFILATTERHKILPTILSRCQCYDFNRIRVEDGAEYLRYIAKCEEVTIDDESLNLIAQKADGAMRDALSMFDKAVSFGGRNLNFKEVAQSLGVIDYESYFCVVDNLLEGRYHSALITLDELLGAGFSTSSFLSGLARHMRDLLVAQDETTLKLMELTSELTRRYREQASRCSVEFLFGAISTLAKCDGELKRSSNQRLLVELGLMKISGLGQKKNIDNPLLEVTLKEVESKEARREATVVVEPTPAPVVTPPTPTPSPTPKPPTPSPIFNLNEAIEAAQKSKIKGEEMESEGGIKRVYDPEAESKITSSKGQIVEFLATSRPRLKPLFEVMKIKDSVISLESPTEELREEILRNETELMTKIVEIAGVEGYVELQIVVNEEIRAKRPIKIEDRVAHFIALNPEVVKLTEALDLQVD